MYHAILPRNLCTSWDEFKEFFPRVLHLYMVIIFLKSPERSINMRIKSNFTTEGGNIYWAYIKHSIYFQREKKKHCD